MIDYFCINIYKMSLSITLIIIIFTVIVSMQGFNHQEFMYKLSLSPFEIKHSKKYYKFFTYLFEKNKMFQKRK